MQLISWSIVDIAYGLLGMLAILFLGMLIFTYQKRQNCKKARREAGFLMLSSRADYMDEDSDDILSEEDVILNGVCTSKSKDYGAALATDDDESDDEEDLFSVHTTGLPAKNLNV